MSVAARIRARLLQSEGELHLLSKEIDVWQRRRDMADVLDQYRSQLESLNGVLSDALSVLRAELGTFANATSTREAYVDCRHVDHGVVWLRTLWLYYKEKFDQRDDPVVGECLRAADEVVWSCYADSFENAGRACQTAPLCYLEPVFTPHAIPRVDPPSALRSVTSDKLRKTIEQLPIPVIELPVICAQAPVWMVYIAHEVGHHIQHDLQPNAELIVAFRRHLTESAMAGGAVKDESKKWGNWGWEIFADLFSVHCMGPAAVSSIAELEHGTEAEMVSEHDLYPPPVVRLQLLALAAERLNTIPPDMPEAARDQIDNLLGDDVGLGLKPVSQFLKQTPRIVQRALTTGFGTVGTFQAMTEQQPDDFRPGGTAYQYQQTLADGRVVDAPKQARSARLILTGGYRAWSQVAQSDQPDRDEQLAALRDCILESLIANRPEGTRAVDEESEAGVDGSQLALELLALSDPELVPRVSSLS